MQREDRGTTAKPRSQTGRCLKSGSIAAPVVGSQRMLFAVPLFSFFFALFVFFAVKK